MTASRDLDVTFEAVGSTRAMPARVEVGLYRIAQEALSNAARHARASRATVRLETMPDRVRLEVRDDGSGFQPSQVSSDRFGLLGIRERARLLSGSLRLDSAPGVGTLVEVTIPLAEGQADRLGGGR
jgi:signal transduction histidine kinase